MVETPFGQKVGWDERSEDDVERATDPTPSPNGYGVGPTSPVQYCVDDF